LWCVSNHRSILYTIMGVSAINSFSLFRWLCIHAFNSYRSFHMSSLISVCRITTEPSIHTFPTPSSHTPRPLLHSLNTHRHRQQLPSHFHHDLDTLLATGTFFFMASIITHPHTHTHTRPPHSLTRLLYCSFSLTYIYTHTQPPPQPIKINHVLRHQRHRHPPWDGQPPPRHLC
jgi:hypothetical protein